MLRFAVDYDGPVALRYPRGTAYDGCEEFRAPIQYGRSGGDLRGGEHRYRECRTHV